MKYSLNDITSSLLLKRRCYKCQNYDNAKYSTHFIIDKVVFAFVIIIASIVFVIVVDTMNKIYVEQLKVIFLPNWL